MLFALFIKIDANDFVIKSLRVYSSLSEISFPIIDKSDSSKKTITIEFDVQGDYAPNLNIVFKFCDKDWIPYENIFLANIGYNTEYNLWLEKLPLRVTDARYHYAGVFPNQNVTFPFSGKWKFFIVDSQNPDKIYGEGKFFVVIPEVKMNISITKNRIENVIPEIAALGRTITIFTSFTLPDTLFESNIQQVEIIENKKISYPIIIDKAKLTEQNYYEWNGGSKFLFIAKNIKTGNEYRQTDLRDINRFNQKNVNAQYDGIEVSNFFKKRNRDYNGGSILTNYKSDYAEYMNVTFRIRPPENLTASIFLVGAFNNWQVLPDYEMFDDNGLLNLTIELKRGVYDYQYVTAENTDGEIKNIDWYILEGNFWETENDYHVFLYYQTPEKGGYDKIIGYKKINSGGL
ncbi:MAG: type IX secretion system plug protein domain-containing protein [Melioribacteraceae bacterium]